LKNNKFLGVKKCKIKNQIEIILADRKAGKIYVLRIFKKPMPQRHQTTASLKEASDIVSGRVSLSKLSKPIPLYSKYRYSYMVHKKLFLEKFNVTK